MPEAGGRYGARARPIAPSAGAACSVPPGALLLGSNEEADGCPDDAEPIAPGLSGPIRSGCPAQTRRRCAALARVAREPTSWRSREASPALRRPSARADGERIARQSRSCRGTRQAGPSSSRGHERGGDGSERSLACGSRRPLRRRDRRARLLRVDLGVRDRRRGSPTLGVPDAGVAPDRIMAARSPRRRRRRPAGRAGRLGACSRTPSCPPGTTRSGPRGAGHVRWVDDVAIFACDLRTRSAGAGSASPRVGRAWPGAPRREDASSWTTRSSWDGT